MKLFRATMLLLLTVGSASIVDAKTVEEKWPDGSVKVRREFTDDVQGRPVQNGLEAHFGPGGVKESELTYEYGMLDGPWKEYYLSGKVRTEGSYKHGLKDGVETGYSESGQKSMEANYSNGRRDGVCTQWSNGQKVLEATYEDGRLIGTLRQWFGKGTPRLVQTYQAGVLNGPEQRLVCRRNEIYVGQLCERSKRR